MGLSFLLSLAVRLLVGNRWDLKVDRAEIILQLDCNNFAVVRFLIQLED